MEIEKTIFKTGNSYAIVIPSNIIKKLKLKKGDHLSIDLIENDIIMRII